MTCQRQSEIHVRIGPLRILEKVTFGHQGRDEPQDALFPGIIEPDEAENVLVGYGRPNEKLLDKGLPNGE